MIDFFRLDSAVLCVLLTVRSISIAAVSFTVLLAMVLIAGDALYSSMTSLTRGVNIVLRLVTFFVGVWTGVVSISSPFVCDNELRRVTRLCNEPGMNNFSDGFGGDGIFAKSIAANWSEIESLADRLFSICFWNIDRIVFFGCSTLPFIVFRACEPDVDFFVFELLANDLREFVLTPLQLFAGRVSFVAANVLIGFDFCGVFGDAGTTSFFTLSSNFVLTGFLTNDLSSPPKLIVLTR